MPPKSYLSDAPVQPLEHLIKLGAFLRDSRQRSRPPDFFTPAQKQAIALKLARCFMDFFDSESNSPAWDLGKVYLVAPPGNRTQDRLIYVAFNNGNPHPPTAPPDIGHPVLLAFAKLLLEIDDGNEIDLSQCGSSVEQWAQLCVHAQAAERAGSGLYALAVSACLYLHVNFPRDEDPKAEIRRRIHQRVVSQLEAALNRPDSMERKRRRVDSWDKSISEKTNKHAAMDRPNQDTYQPHTSKRQRIESRKQENYQTRTEPPNANQTWPVRARARDSEK